MSPARSNSGRPGSQPWAVDGSDVTVMSSWLGSLALIATLALSACSSKAIGRAKDPSRTKSTPSATRATGLGAETCRRTPLRKDLGDAWPFAVDAVTVSLQRRWRSVAQDPQWSAAYR